MFGELPGDMTSKDIRWPCQISQSLEQELLSIARVEHGLKPMGLKTGYSELKGICYVLEGTSALCFPSFDLNSVSSFLIGRHDWFGLLAIDSRIKGYVITEEIEPITFLLFPKKSVETLARQQVEVYKWMFYIGKSVNTKWMQANISSLHDLHSRVVYILLELMLRQPIMAGVLPRIKISQQQLGLLTGISRPRLNEVLKAFEQAGDISLQRGFIQILDQKALAQRLNNLNLCMRDPREYLD